MTSTRRATSTLSLALVAVALAVAGCADDDDGLGGAVANTEALALVGPAEVRSAPVDSPRRTVLEWWRLMQYRNPGEAIQLYEPSVQRRLRSGGFDRLVHRDFGPCIARARPEEVRVERRGNEATVFMQVMVKQGIGPDIVKRSQELVALPLARIDGRWRLSDASFFLGQADILRRDRLRAEREAARR